MQHPYGRPELHNLDNGLEVRTPDSLARAYSRLLQLLETAGYKVEKTIMDKKPPYQILVSRANPEIPGLVVAVSFVLYKGRKSTSISVDGPYTQPGQKGAWPIHYYKNKDGKTDVANWAELYRAATLYPETTVL